MKNKQHYVEIALKAAKRAALKLSVEASKKNNPLPVWKNDHVEFEIPNYPLQTVSVDS